MSRFPCSPRERVGGFAYLPRMFDKIRLQLAGELGPDYQASFGKGADGFCCGFLRIDHAALVERVRAGGTDEDLLHWCQEHGRPLNEADATVWNGFILKLGWHDFAMKRLRDMKEKCGLADRPDILTMADYIDADEGRSAEPAQP